MCRIKFIKNVGLHDLPKKNYSKKDLYFWKNFFKTFFFLPKSN